MFVFIDFHWYIMTREASCSHVRKFRYMTTKVVNYSHSSAITTNMMKLDAEICLLSYFINWFHANDLFLYPLKNQRFFLSFQRVYKETSDMKYVNNFVCKNSFKLSSCSNNILNWFLMSCCRVVAIVGFEEAFDWEALS